MDVNKQSSPVMYSGVVLQSDRLYKELTILHAFMDFPASCFYFGTEQIMNFLVFPFG